MADEPVLPTLGAVGWARWAWRQLTSMRTALLLLFMLAVAAVPGSVFPQRRVDPTKVATYLDEHPGYGAWLDKVGLFDVYTSVWFSAIYLLLFVSLVGCVLPRARLHWRAMRAQPPRTPRRLERLEAYRAVTVDSGAARLLDVARDQLRRQRYRVAVHDEGASLSAERGYLAETGNLLFHLALLGVLIAVAAGAFTGYGGQITVVEGQRFSNIIPGYNSFTAGTRVDPAGMSPFSFTLDRLAVKFEETTDGGSLGAPRDFTATMTVTAKPGAKPYTRTVQVNHPLEVDGVKAYLVGNGYAPVITVKDGSGKVAFSGPVVALTQTANYQSMVVVKVPDAAPRQIALQGLFLPTALLEPGGGWVSVFPDAHNPRLLITGYVSQPGKDGLGLNNGVPKSVFQLDTSDLTQLKTSDGQIYRTVLAPGQSHDLPDGAGSVTFEGYLRYAAFDVHYDPTKLWALGTSSLALIGLTLSLFVKRRRVWVRVTQGEPGQGSRVEVAGLARGEDPGLDPQVARLLAAIAPGATIETPVPVGAVTAGAGAAGSKE